MSLELHALKQLQVAIEPSGSYGVTIGSGFVQVPVSEGFEGFSPMREMLDPAISTGTIDGSAVKIPARKQASLKFDMPFGSHGLDLDGDVAIPAIATYPVGALLGTVLGGVSTLAAQTSQILITSGSTTTVLNVTPGRGSQWFAVGMPIGCMVNGRLEVTEIVASTVDTVTVRQAFSAVPTVGTPVRIGPTFFPASDPQNSLQFLVSGAEVDDHFRVLGAQGGLSVEAKIGQLAKLGFDLKAQSWIDEAAHSGLAEASYVNYSPVVASGGCVTVPAFGSSTRVEPLVSDFSMTFGLAYEAISSYCATDTIARMRRTRAQGGKLARGSFVVPFEDSTWINARDSQAIQSIYFQIGSTVGATVLLAFPRVQIVNVTRGASGVLAGQTVEWEAMPDSIGALSAPFRIHLL